MTDYNILDNENIEVRGDKVKYISFKRYNDIPFIKNCFSTRHGGVSKEHLSSMNLGFNRGDDIENVIENYRHLFNECGFTLDNVIMSDQVHETHIQVIDESVLDKYNNCEFYQRKLEATDGMVTNLKNVPLVTYYADCVPLYFVDTNKKAIGLSHSGWRGTVGLMGLKTINKMIEEYGTDVKDLICAVGPSICQSCYEVSKEVIDNLLDSFNRNEIEIEDEHKLFYATKEDKFQLNLWEANRLIIKKAGVPSENIIISQNCTCCNHSLLYSHRASNGNRGNLVAVLEII